MLFEFYSKNPFEKPTSYRVKDIANAKLTPQEQFVKNFIAYLFYEQYALGFGVVKFQKVSQQVIYSKFRQGLVQSKYFDFEEKFTSNIHKFSNAEVFHLFNTNQKSELEYLKFVIDNESNFKALDQLINYIAKKKITFSNYLKELNFNDFQFITERLDAALEDLTDVIMKSIASAYVDDLSLNDFKTFHIDHKFKQINFILNTKLIEKEELKKIKKLTVSWFDDFIYNFCFYCDSEGIQRTTSILLTKFYDAIEHDQTEEINESADYPKHIFSSAKAYHLFNDFATQHYARIVISYLFRRMSEKEQFIIAKDTPFRNWFNKENFTIKLHSATDTYERSSTDERKAHVDLLYKAYGLSNK